MKKNFRLDVALFFSSFVILPAIGSMLIASAGSWQAKILEVALPDTALLVRHEKMTGGPILTRSSETTEAPPNEKTWIVLVVELLPPQPKSELKVSNIKLIDEASNKYSLHGISVHTKPWKFSPVKGYLQSFMSTGEDITWAIWPGKSDLVFYKDNDKPGWAALLFVIPRGLTNLQLQIQKGVTIPVTTE
jgi:hypothetical protein